MKKVNSKHGKLTIFDVVCSAIIYSSFVISGGILVKEFVKSNDDHNSFTHIVSDADEFKKYLDDAEWQPYYFFTLSEDVSLLTHDKHHSTTLSYSGRYYGNPVETSLNLKRALKNTKTGDVVVLEEEKRYSVSDLENIVFNDDENKKVSKKRTPVGDLWVPFIDLEANIDFVHEYGVDFDYGCFQTFKGADVSLYMKPEYEINIATGDIRKVSQTIPDYVVNLDTGEEMRQSQNNDKYMVVPIYDETGNIVNYEKKLYVEPKILRLR